MKANELMIGDWVMFPNSIEKVQEVDYIEGKGYCASFAASATLFPIPIDKLKPIPLTPEILEKNGFTDWANHSRTTRSCSLLVDKTNIIVQKIDGTDYIFTQIHRGGADSCEFRMDLKYVHELQHALKLCGIEKTIEL